MFSPKGTIYTDQYRYIPAFRGVVLAHSNLSFSSDTAPFLVDSPFARVDISFTALIWSPEIGSRICMRTRFINFQSDRIHQAVRPAYARRITLGSWYTRRSMHRYHATTSQPGSGNSSTAHWKMTQPLELRHSVWTKTPRKILVDGFTRPPVSRLEDREARSSLPLSGEFILPRNHTSLTYSASTSPNPCFH